MRVDVNWFGIDRFQFYETFCEIFGKFLFNKKLWEEDCAKKIVKADGILKIGKVNNCICGYFYLLYDWVREV